MKLSIVIPAYNEGENLYTLHKEIVEGVSGMNINYEVVYVNDGSSDNTADVLNNLQAANPNINNIHLQQNSGQSYATMRGIQAAQGTYIVTMDADCQNDPADIPHLFAKLNNTCRAVCGWRRQRKDKGIFVVSSKVANAIIRNIFGLKVHDSGCSLRVAEAQHLKSINYFNNFHRYIPIILHLKGITLAEVEVNHRWRTLGQSKYSIFKSIKVLRELLYLRTFYKA